MSKETRQRGSALVRLLRSTGDDPEIKQGVAEYTSSWFQRFGGVRHTPPEALVLLSAQQSLVRGLAIIHKRITTQSDGTDEVGDLLKILIPASNSYRLNERSLERLAGVKGTGRKTTLADISARYERKNKGGQK